MAIRLPKPFTSDPKMTGPKKAIRASGSNLSLPMEPGQA
jgi:hypothetical protein